MPLWVQEVIAGPDLREADDAPEKGVGGVACLVCLCMWGRVSETGRCVCFVSLFLTHSRIRALSHTNTDLDQQDTPNAHTDRYQHTHIYV